MDGKRAELFIKMVLAENESSFTYFYNKLQGTLLTRKHHVMWLQINGLRDQFGKPRKLKKDELKERKAETRKKWGELNKEYRKEYMRQYYLARKCK